MDKLEEALVPHGSRNVLLFSPFADVWAHSMIERVVANVLISRGAKVTWACCKGSLAPLCTVMRARGRVWEPTVDTQNVNKICDDCRAASQVRLSSGPFKTVNIDDLVTSQELTDIQKMINELNLDSILELEREGLSLGRFAVYEVVLASKIDTPEGLSAHIDELKNSLRQCMITQIAVAKLLKQNEFDMFLVYNNLYGSNRTAIAAAKQAGLECRVMHGGMDFKNLWNSLVIYENYATHYSLPQASAWQSRQSETLTKQAVADVSASHIFSMTGRSPFVYSRPIPRFGSRKTNLHSTIIPQPTVLCLMSSTDEGVAARLSGAFTDQHLYGQGALFESADEWLRSIAEFAYEHQDIRFIIRPHPREFPNHRDSSTAASSSRYSQLSGALPSNVMICWPHLGISLYESALYARVVLNHTSSAGCEMMQLGLPVVTHDRSAMFAYPRVFNLAPTSTSEYWRSVLSLLEQPLDFERVKVAYRFRSWQIHDYSIGLSDVLKNRNDWDLQRVLTGLRDQKGFRVVADLVDLLRTREAQAVGLAAASERIARALRVGSSLGRRSAETPIENMLELESRAIRKSLSQISKILLKLDASPGALGQRIQKELVELAA